MPYYPPDGLTGPRSSGFGRLRGIQLLGGGAAPLALPTFDSHSGVKQRVGRGALNWSHSPVGEAEAILIYASNGSSGSVLTAASGTSMSYGGIPLSQLSGTAAIYGQQGGTWWWANGVSGRANDNITTWLDFFNFGHLFICVSVLVDSGGNPIEVKQQGAAVSSNAPSLAASTDANALYLCGSGNQGFGAGGIGQTLTGPPNVLSLSHWIDSQRRIAMGYWPEVEDGNTLGVTDGGPSNGMCVVGVAAV